ncbi:hypothetical protein YW3DRAFT_07153 [Streptomyces sp. MnatMP-M77]|uniref:hypothetical protein n=1 Tax=unclassified Streptomyces TaxID=2593676 RepID=UPI000804B633|nr:hypothetical protein [Streptomyces sp. MnatMP-M77]MYT79317.1 hypothetical protein [Streptomyces sp. SID8364]SBV03903.1 hypothetical protein YW3DRAFT_07153 [Streptomyces sp. MnatMP-M77]
MSTDLAALRSLVNSPPYLAALDRALTLSGLTLNPVEHPMITAIDAESLRLAGVTEAELADLVTEHAEPLARFVRLKMQAYSKDTEEQGVDRDPGDPAGGDNLVELDPTPGFLVGHALELVLLLDRPQDFPAYARRQRIPHAARYAREVQALAQEAFRPELL